MPTARDNQRAALSGARAKLFATRQARPHHGHDDKVLTSWNGLMLAAFAEAAAARIDGFLEDYAHLAEGPLALYQATFDPRWYQAAHDLVDTAITLFWVGGEGFYDTAADAEELIARPRDLEDNATPSSNSMMATVLLKLSDLSMVQCYAEVARQNLVAVQPFLAQAPLGFGQWLVALA
jgi:uncharacterized protein YyaL (SSP411 family)